MKKQSLLTLFYYSTLAFICSILFIQCDKKKSIEDLLKDEVAVVNKQCPILEDAVTRRDSCSIVDGKTFQYHYTLLEVDSASIADFKNEGIINVKSNVKANPLYAPFRDEDVTFRLIYSDTLGIELFRFDVTPEDYKE